MRRALKLRPQVAAFAQLMESVLRENDHKGGWHNCSYTYLHTRLVEEVEELAEAITSYAFAKPMEDRGDVPVFVKRQAMQSEAVDVANFCMMLVDNSGGLKPKRHRKKGSRS